MTHVETLRWPRLARWTALVAVSLAVALLQAPGTAGAAMVTIGASNPDVANPQAGGGGGSGGISDGITVSNSLIPGQPVSSPVNGTITSWALSTGSGGLLGATLRLIRPVGTNSYLFVASSTNVLAAAPLSGSSVRQSFPTSIPVAAGDRIALTINHGIAPYVVNPSVSNEVWLPPTPPPDGAVRSPDQATNGVLFLFNATIEYSEAQNKVAVRSLTRNRRRGTAVLTLGVPGPGQLTVSAGGAQIAGTLSRSFTAAGDTQVTVRASGKKRRKLIATGKVRLNLSVSFTPSGGQTQTDSVAIKLRKKG